MDVTAITAVLAPSLADEPFFRTLLPAGPQRAHGAEWFFSAYALTHLGRNRALDLACTVDGRIVGVAAWTYRSQGRSSLASRQTGRSLRYVRAIGARRILRTLRLRRASSTGGRLGRTGGYRSSPSTRPPAARGSAPRY